MNPISTEVDTTESDAAANSALAHANALKITTVADYQEADAYCRGLFNLRKSIEADFADSLEAADKAKKAATEAKAALVDQIASHVQPVQDAEKVIKVKLLIWSQEQEKARRIEQDRLRAEAIRKAEDEQLRKAEVLHAQGKTAAAEAVIAATVKVVSIIAPPAPVERESKITSYWSYEIIEPAAVNRDFCKPDPGSIQKSMNAYKAQGKTIEEVQDRIGGIRIEVRIK